MNDNPPANASSEPTSALETSPTRAQNALAAATLLAIVGLLLFKVRLADRLNINWDEFYFLSNVYALLRGELSDLMQSGYTHLFTWVALVGGDEVAQIGEARLVMVALLAVTALLVWVLARTWLAPLPAAIAVFVFVSARAVLVHGGSFRIDSLLAPLIVASLALLARRRADRLSTIVAGALLGLAFVGSVKTVLSGPVVLGICAYHWLGRNGGTRDAFRRLAVGSGLLAIVAAATAATLLGLHATSLAAEGGESMVSFAGRVGAATVVDPPLFARWAYFHRYLVWQPLSWVLIAAGTALAIQRRRFDLASLALALLPIAIYRNAFPYYYVVMLAPACVLAGYAVGEIFESVRARASARSAHLLIAMVWAGLLYQGLPRGSFLAENQQLPQSAVVAAVHDVFPEPVNYIDRCGMISSFRSAGFFMTSWGMQTYHATGKPFMARAIREHRPAFVLVNAIALDPSYSSASGLLPEDRDAIRSYYPVYWGPIRVAGATASLGPGQATRVAVPFPGRYRLESPEPVFVDGLRRNPGDVVDAGDDVMIVRRDVESTVAEPASIQFVLAIAGPRPRTQPPDGLFTGL